VKKKTCFPILHGSVLTHAWWNEALWHSMVRCTRFISG